MPEYALTRNYLELMVELPWSKSTKGKGSLLCFCRLWLLQIVWKMQREEILVLLPGLYIIVAIWPAETLKLGV